MSTPNDSSSAGFQQPPSSETLLSALAEWTELWRQDSALRASAIAWSKQLQVSAVYWKACGHRARELIAEEFNAIVGLAHQLSESRLSHVPTQLRQWIDYSDAVYSLWQTPNRTWNDLLVDPARNDNLVVSAAVSQALAHSLKEVRLPRTVTSPLAPLIQASASWCGQLRIPPAPGFSRDPSGYLCYAQNAKAIDGIREQCELIDSALNGFDKLSAQLTSLSADNENAKMIHSALQRIRPELDSLTDELAHATAGWPIQSSLLDSKARSLIAMLAECGRLENEFTKDSGQLSAAKGSLLELVEQCSRHGSHVRASMRSKTPVAGPTMAAPAEPMPVYRQLERLSSELMDDVDGTARRFATRLKNLADGWPRELTATVRLDSDRPRELLRCLAFLDTLSLQEGKKLSWLEKTREELRGVVSDEGTYEIISEELIGRDLNGCYERAEAIGSIESRRVKSGYIADIQQPGYALRNNRGQAKILQKAKVLLAK